MFDSSLFIAKVSSLVLFSILGTFLRQRLVEVSSSSMLPPLFPELWPNVLGSLAIGLFTSYRSDLLRLMGTGSGASISLLLGLTTGFCGSLTTFSSWALAACKVLVDRGSRPRLDHFILIWIIGFTSSVGFVHLGFHIGTLLTHLFRFSDSRARPSHSASKKETPANAECVEASTQSDEVIVFPTVSAPASLDHERVFGSRTDVVKNSRSMTPPAGSWSAVYILVTGLGSLCLLALCAVLTALTSNKKRELYWVPGLMCSVGTLLRWQLSVFLNGKSGRLASLVSAKSGTLAANLIATAITASCSGVLATCDNKITEGWHLVLKGLVGGVAGCLGTVSTLASELAQYNDDNDKNYTNKRVVVPERLWGAYSYGAVTVVSSSVLGSLIYRFARCY